MINIVEHRKRKKIRGALSGINGPTGARVVSRTAPHFDRCYFQLSASQFDDIIADCSRYAADGYAGIVAKPPEAYSAGHTSVNLLDYGFGATRPTLRHFRLRACISGPNGRPYRFLRSSAGRIRPVTIEEIASYLVRSSAFRWNLAPSKGNDFTRQERSPSCQYLFISVVV